MKNHAVIDFRSTKQGEKFTENRQFANSATEKE